MLSQPELLFGLLSTVTALALIGFVTLFWKLQRVTRDLTTMRHRLEDGPVEPDSAGFSKDLLVARFKQEVREVPTASAATDRYRYVASLVRNGLDAPQIAEILNLGRGEAEQLVSLALLCVAPQADNPPEHHHAGPFNAPGEQAA